MAEIYTHAGADMIEIDFPSRNPIWKVNLLPIEWPKRSKPATIMMLTWTV